MGCFSSNVFTTTTLSIKSRLFILCVCVCVCVWPPRDLIAVNSWQDSSPRHLEPSNEACLRQHPARWAVWISCGTQYNVYDFHRPAAPREVSRTSAWTLCRFCRSNQGIRLCRQVRSLGDHAQNRLSSWLRHDHTLLPWWYDSYGCREWPSSHPVSTLQMARSRAVSWLHSCSSSSFPWCFQ